MAWRRLQIHTLFLPWDIYITKTKDYDECVDLHWDLSGSSDVELIEGGYTLRQTHGLGREVLTPSPQPALLFHLKETD